MRANNLFFSFHVHACLRLLHPDLPLLGNIFSSPGRLTHVQQRRGVTFSPSLWWVSFGWHFGKVFAALSFRLACPSRSPTAAPSKCNFKFVLSEHKKKVVFGRLFESLTTEKIGQKFFFFSLLIRVVRLFSCYSWNQQFVRLHKRPIVLNSDQQKNIWYSDLPNTRASIDRPRSQVVISWVFHMKLTCICSTDTKRNNHGKYHLYGEGVGTNKLRIN